LDPYAVLDRAYQALGRASAGIVGTAEVKEQAGKADGRELPDARVLALAADVWALAALLGGKGG
jgi:hypothetical protein